MASSHGFVQLPPDGAGKQVPQSVMIELEYDQATGSFAEGDIITLSVATNIDGTIVAVNEHTGTTGEIHVRIDEPVPSTITITIGENIIVNALVIAKVSKVYDPLYFQQVTMVGKDMNNQLEIDERGSLVARFPDGSPQFDAFGKIQTSEQTILGEYTLSYDDRASEYTTEITGGATSVFHQPTRGIVLTNGLASGDKVVRTTDEYHVYQTGFSQLIEFSGAMGDTGKANVIRRGGYYDDDNGVYFEFKETVFGVGIRSKTSGSVVDTFIPQTEWNKDRLDGTAGDFNPSRQQANPTIANLYWIDLTWPAGVVRFGVVISGERIVAHEFKSSTAAPYMSTASLPLRYEQENIGVAGSSSEFRMFAGTVKTEGREQPLALPYTASTSANITSVVSAPLIALRPIETFKTFDNRCTTYPRGFNVYNDGAEPIEIQLHRGTTAVAGTWAAESANSSTEINNTATSFTGGEPRVSFMVGPGATHEFPFPTLEEARRGIRRKADITSVFEMQVSARLLVAGAGGNVYLSLNWEEVRD